MDQFTEKSELSSMMDSKEIPLLELNCKNLVANSVQTMVNQHNGENSDCSLRGQSMNITPEQITISKHVFDKSLNGTALDPALLTVTSLENYSDVSSCSETDFGQILNALEKNPDHSSELKDANISKDKIEFEIDLCQSSTKNAQGEGVEATENPDVDSVGVMDGENIVERSILNVDYPYSNLGTTKSENECHLQTDKQGCNIQNTDCGVTEISGNCRDLMDAKLSIEGNKNAISIKSQSVQNDYHLKGINTILDAGSQYDRAQSSQEVEHSSFDFLQSCFGLSSLDKTNLNQNAAEISFSGCMTKHSQNCVTNQTQTPVRATLESVPTGLLHETTDGVLLKPLMEGICSGPTVSQDLQQHDEAIKDQIIKGSTGPESPYDADDKNRAFLLSYKELTKKLQPVILVKTAKQNVKDRNMYICSLCQNNMQTLDELIEHHHCKHSKHTFQYCLTCGTYFTTETVAEQHLCEQNKIDNTVSDNNTVLSISKQPETKRLHANLKCKFCQKPFIKRSYHQDHEQRHITVTQHRCGYCGLYFPNAKKLGSHEQRIRCLPLILEPSKRRKINSKNSDPKSPTKLSSTFKVDGCQIGIHDCFVKLVDIKRSSSEKNYCSLCGKRFKLRAQLKEHLRSHTDAKPFKCDKCKKVFKYSWNLDKHKKEPCSGGTTKHTTQPSTYSCCPRKFACPTCPQTFMYSYNRIRHMRQRCLSEYMKMGNGKVGNLYKCPMCTKTFSQVSYRNRHIKKSCFEQYKLQRKSTWKLEEKNSNEEKEKKQELGPDYLSGYKCGICPATFAHKSGVYRHMKTHSLLQPSTVQVGKHANYADVNNPGSKNEASQTQVCSRPNSTDVVTNPNTRCRFCDKSFTSNNLLKNHLRLHVGKKPFHCLECGKNFGRRGHLLAHKNVHKRKIQCSVCKIIMPTLGDLLKHRECHVKKGMLKCPDCPMQFKFPVFLRRHSVTHVKKKEIPKSLSNKTSTVKQEEEIRNESFKCGICQITFVDSKAMSEHCLTHLPKPSICMCPVCNHNFTCRTGLIRHLRLHTGEKPFPCKNCGKRFHRKEHLIPHAVKCKESEPKPLTSDTAPTQQECTVKAVSKPDKIPKKFSCTYCPHIFTMSGPLIMHEKAHLANNLSPCLNCGKYYKKNKVGGHQKRCKIKESTSEVTFNREKSANASECNGANLVVPNRTCKILNSLKTNIKDSFKERCPHCPKRYQFRSYLLRHLPTHFGKQFACKHCNKKYGNKRSCQQHEASCDSVLQQHESEELNKPNEDKIVPDAQSGASIKDCTGIIGENHEQFKCNFCTKTFTKLKNLRRHILGHTEVKPYSCKACEESFSRCDYLMRHQTRCRGKKQQLDEEQAIKKEDTVGLQADGLECNICLKNFSSQSNLTRHFSIKHSTVKPFSCKICGTGFTSKDSLRKHSVKVKCNMSSEYPEPVDPTNSNVTVQPCRETSKLLQRIEGHYSDKWKFPCEYCPRRFKNQAQLIVHTRLHTGEKPFGCATCDERFIRSDYLKRHLSKCSGKRPSAKVLCDQCGGLFTREALEMHQKICISLNSTDPPENKRSISSPSNVKVFSCVQCSKHFLLFSQLEQHIFIHHKSDSLQQSGTLKQEKLSCNFLVKEEPLEDNYAENLQSNPQIYENNGHENTDDNTTMYPLSFQESNKDFCTQNVQEKHTRICTGLEMTQNECGKKDWILSDLERTPNDEVIVFDKGSHTTGTGVLQTKFSCKDQDKGNAEKGNTIVNKYQCSECEQSFTDGLMLISHLEAHGREDQERRLGKSHRCNICGKTFEQAGVLQRHVKTQHQETLKNTCHECFKNFRFPSDLEIHRACHDPNRPVVCNTCKLRFWTVKSLRSHQRLSHPVAELTHTLEPTMKTDTLTPKVFACHPCNKIYSIKKSYMEHLRLKHKNPSSLNGLKIATMEQESSDCKLDASDADDKDVSDDDSDSAPYFPCHVCGKTFVTSESLEDHQRCHLGEKPYECEECGKCFIQLGNLQQHQRSHKSEFQCQMCGKGFVSLFALRKHKHTHLKKRPHRCTKCHLSFTRPSELAEHMITHRDENFPCDLCHEIFSCKSSRAEHRKMHAEAEEELPALIPPATQAIASPPVSISPTVGTLQQYKYRCEICQVRFPDPEQLSEHGCSPAKERPYSCKHCNKHFLHGSHLKKHQLTHQLSGTRSFQCNSCHMCFRHRHHFLTHLQTHGGEESTNSQTNDTDDLNQDKIYKCPICPESFSQVLELANHLSVHANMCNVCNKTFSTKQQLEKHEKCHLSAATQYECTECGKSFLGSDSFRQHSCVHQKHLSSSSSSTTHKRRRLEPYSVLPTNNEEEDVDVGEDFFKCPTCNKRFSSNITLKEHEKLHEIDRPFKCMVCGKSFAKKKYLTRHQRIHQTSSYQCDLCPKSFKTEQSLLAHHKAHNKDHNYRCSVCNKSYKTPFDLSRHEQRHPELQNVTRVTGNHRCDMCYKSFGLLSQLRKHQETHVGQVVYECTECDKAFAFLHLLEEHQQTHIL